jgi:hypothetical protein
MRLLLQASFKQHKIASGTGVWQAFGTVALGWMTFWVLQRTVGQPIAKLGHWVTCQVAGVELITRHEQLLSTLSQRLRTSSVTDLEAVDIPETEKIVEDSQQRNTPSQESFALSASDAEIASQTNKKQVSFLN